MHCRPQQIRLKLLHVDGSRLHAACLLWTARQASNLTWDTDPARSRVRGRGLGEGIGS